MRGEVLSTGEDAYTHVLMVLEEAADGCEWSGWFGAKSLRDHLIGTGRPVLARVEGRNTVGYFPDPTWERNPLGNVLFGGCREDPRRVLWKRVSKPWGFGSMAALRDMGLLTRDQTQHTHRLGPDQLRTVLAAVCEAADAAGELAAFDEWLRGRIRDPEGGGYSDRTALEARLKVAMDALNDEALGRLVDLASYMVSSPDNGWGDEDTEALAAFVRGKVPGAYRDATKGAE